MSRTKKVIKISLVSLTIVFAAIQLARPSFENPPVVESERFEASMAVPEDVAAILKRSCSDCHSNETVYPWYAQISPVSWWLKHHVDEGRMELNFSKWGTYARDRKVRKLEEICEQVESEAMPLPSYTWVHGDAVLKKEEGRRLCEWTRDESWKMNHGPAAN